MAKDIGHIVILLALIGSVVFLFTWTGVIKCNIIPGWCDAYWFIVRGGEPRILIVSGDFGMGNPDLLEQTLRDPTHAGAITTQAHIDRITLGNLQEFDLVIVERARQMETAKLRMFMDYVDSGGRLVWTGDAGVELGREKQYPGNQTIEDEYLFEDEDPNLDSNVHRMIGPWARKEGTRIVPFHEFLGVQYETNYCSIKECTGRPWQGVLITNPSRDHPLVYALRPNLVLRGDFAIVTDVSGSITTRALTLDWFSELIGQDQLNYGRTFPLITTSGYGERIAYYAVPPEQFVAEDLEEKYYSIVENVYYGMLR